MCVGGVNCHQKWRGFSTTTVHSRASLDFASSASCEQMVTEPKNIYIEVLDLVLTDADFDKVRVGLAVGTSNHSAIFIDVVLE